MDVSNQAGSDPRVLRLVRPSVVVLCGPAGCGKSTFATKHFRPTQVISSDRCRALVCDDERDQRFQEQAFALLDFILDLRLDLNRLCVVDSTAITQAARRSLLERARRHGVPCVAMVFDVSLESCLAHDRERTRTVGSAIVERQHQVFQQVKTGIGQEGFEQVVVLREEDIEKAQVEVAFRPVMDRTGAFAATRHARPFERRAPRHAPRPSESGPGPAGKEGSPPPATGATGDPGSPVVATHDPAGGPATPDRDKAPGKVMASAQRSGGNGSR